MSLKWPNKDKDEVLDYSIDWSRFLEEGETVTSVSWKIKDASGDKVDFNPSSTVNGLTLVVQSNTTTVATIYLSNGTDNTEYTLYCNVGTSASRVAERPVKIRIREYN
jgi:hypothetical protein